LLGIKKDSGAEKILILDMIYFVKKKIIKNKGQVKKYIFK
jgi:hypothetical protein